MSNWYGTCRSNYFRVKDVDAFAAMLGLHEARLIEADGKVGFVSEDEYGSIPSRFDEDDESADQISILDEIAEHLAEHEVCVVLEAGSEKARYITGDALAIAWTGERVKLSLSDIYAVAQAEFGGDAQVTEATY
jgi:hypothetical protein